MLRRMVMQASIFVRVYDDSQDPISQTLNPKPSKSYIPNSTHLNLSSLKPSKLQRPCTPNRKPNSLMKTPEDPGSSGRWRSLGSLQTQCSTTKTCSGSGVVYKSLPCVLAERLDVP